MKKKLYLLDWGKEHDGKGRFAIIQSTEKHLWLAVDNIGDASGVKAIEINNERYPANSFYVELIDPDSPNCFANNFNDAWKNKNYKAEQVKDPDWDVPYILDTEERKEWFSIS